MQVEQNILPLCCIRVYLLGPLEVLRSEADAKYTRVNIFSTRNR